MARVVLRADTAGFHRDMRKAEGEFTRTTGQMARGAAAGSGAFQMMGRSVAFASGAFLGAAGLTSVIRGAFEEMGAAQKATAQTNAVLRSTGGIAGVTAEHVDSLATALLRKSGVDDEAVKSGENLLLTFTNVRNVAGENNDVFDQATKAALDMSVAMGEDLNSSVIRIGKALQDPIKGVTALRRVGVLLTKQQQDQVKAFVESGRMMDAQRLILRELTTEFGGSAEALGNTFPGAMNRLRESFRNFTAQVLTGTTDGVAPLVDRLEAWFSNTKNVERVQRDVNEAVRVATGVFGAFADAITGTKDAIDGMNDALDRFHLNWAHHGALEWEVPGWVPGATNKTLFGRFARPAGRLDAVGGGGDFATDEITMTDARDRRGTGAVPPGTVTQRRPRVVDPTGIPWLDNLLAQAEQTSGRTDDRQVVTRIVAVLRSRLARTKNLGQRTALVRAINGYVDALASLDEQDAQAVSDAAAKRKTAREARAERRAASFEIPERLQTLLAAAGLTERVSDDRAVLGRERAFLLAQLRRARLTLQERRQLYEQLASVEGDIDRLDEEQAARREERRQAAEDKRQRARDREELVVQRMEARARLTTGKLDDERALDAEQKLVNRRLAALKKRKQLSNDELREQTALYNELADIRQKREGLRERNEPGRERQAFVGELSGILGQFASNVEASGGRTVIVNQHNYREKSSFAALREARLAAQHVF